MGDEVVDFGWEYLVSGYNNEIDVGVGEDVVDGVVEELVFLYVFYVIDGGVVIVFGEGFEVVVFGEYVEGGGGFYVVFVLGEGFGGVVEWMYGGR